MNNRASKAEKLLAKVSISVNRLGLSLSCRRLVSETDEWLEAVNEEAAKWNGLPSPWNQMCSYRDAAKKLGYWHDQTMPSQPLDDVRSPKY